MSKTSDSNKQAFTDGSADENSNYFRRCHVCGTLTHNDEEHVPRCQHCKKPFAKFQYYDDRFTPVCEDDRLRPKFNNNQYIPIRGLTVHWEPF